MRYTMLGNAIIPKCVVHAWNTLVQHFNNSDKIVIARHPTLVCDKFNELMTATQACVARTLENKGKSAVIRMCDPDDVRIIRLTMNNWRTVTSSREFNKQYQSYHERGAQNLFTQIWYDIETQHKYNTFGIPPKKLHMHYDVNPRFVEWFMGFPSEWTVIKGMES